MTAVSEEGPLRLESGAPRHKPGEEQHARRLAGHIRATLPLWSKKKLLKILL